MTQRIENLSDRLNVAKGKRDAIQDQLNIHTASLFDKEAEQEKAVQAKWVIVEAMKLTQVQFKKEVEKLITNSILSVYDRPLEFKLIFEQKRNAMECRPVVMDGEHELNPKDEMGGGVIDIISISFRAILYFMQEPRSIATFILDEPFKWTGALMEKAGLIVQQLASMGLQFIINTHDPALLGIADKAWHVEHDGTESHVIPWEGYLDD